MGEELRVDTNDLRGKANDINGIDWANPAGQPPITPPSTLKTSLDATANLVHSAQSLWEYQNWGVIEGKRLAESLYHVAKAYDETDLRATSEINAGKPISGGAVKPDDCSIPAPPHPTAPGMPTKAGHAHGDPEEIENELANGDQGAALRAVAAHWRTIATNLQTAAQHFHVKIRDWEGAAAEVAYGRFNEFGGWLSGLAGSWQELAAEADKIADAHTTARAAHTPIADEWKQLKKQMESSDTTDEQKKAIGAKLLKLYMDSEHVRAQYESAATIDKVSPPEPRDGALPSTPVYTNGDPRRRAVPAGDDERQPGGGGSSPGGGGGTPGGGAPGGAPSPMGQPVAPQQPAAARTGGTPGGMPGGGQGAGQGGGKPGGGMPGGLPGGMPGGMPAAAKAKPHLPKGPAVKPAAHGGGGAGGGGGAPRSPLQPAVGANAVAPANAAEAGPGAHAAQGMPGGAMGGGMGGMPMGGHGQGQGKERRRTPGLAPDEELYKEDRSWTEGVIGARRRKDVPDANDGKESK